MGFAIYMAKKRKNGDPDRFLSIVVPARNEESNLARLIPSILNQTHEKFELIVYDDLSEDNTAKIIKSFDDDRINYQSGTTLPEGWLGKVHALSQASKSVQGDTLLFLDADIELIQEDSIAMMLGQFLEFEKPAILSGLPRARGGGLILVSLLSFVVFTGSPWLLAKLLPFKSMTILNGQMWMINRSDYETHQPHEAVKDKILEDVEIGRFMKGKGISTTFLPMTDLLQVNMYENTRAAIHGLSKNAYLLLSGNPIGFIFLWTFFLLTLVLSPFLSLYFLIAIFSLKFITDRWGRLPLWVSLVAPLSMLAGSAVQLYSAFLHWTGNVSWKNRSIK